MDAWSDCWDSAGVSDVGRVRKLNEDSYLDRPDLGLWVVADGMGGHSSGDVASQSICATLAEMPQSLNLSQAVDFFDTCCIHINEQLVNLARESQAGTVIGSTVVALISRGSSAIIIWAGDSRLYRLRDGQLQQLNQDHSFLAESAPDHDPDLNANYGHIITRAVGADDQLFLDLDATSLADGDRYLLCSDGLSNELTGEQLARCMVGGSASDCGRRLVDQALCAGGRDNVTVVVADYQAAPAPLF